MLVVENILLLIEKVDKIFSQAKGFPKAGDHHNPPSQNMPLQEIYTGDFKQKLCLYKDFVKEG